MFRPREQNAKQTHNKNMANKSFEILKKKFVYFGNFKKSPYVY